MHAIGVYILHHALGLQTERMVTELASMVNTEDSHKHALWPKAIRVWQSIVIPIMLCTCGSSSCDNSKKAAAMLNSNAVKTLDPVIGMSK